MLLEFSIENFKCYSNMTTFSFTNNITGIFGTNASGKTNMLNALSKTIKMIKNEYSINKMPYLFRPNNIDKPVSVKLKFSDVNNNIFLYELSVNQTLILEEKYTGIRFNGRDNVLFFVRSSKNIKLYNLHEDDHNLLNMFDEFLLRNNTITSFLFKIKKGLHNAILSLYNFTNSIKIFCNSDIGKSKNNLLLHINNNVWKKEILEFANFADPTISDLNVKNDKIICYHNNFQELPFSQESSGTRKAINMADIFITYKNQNNIFLIDEIDAHFHPLILALWIEKIKLLNGDNQLIFVGHNPIVIDFLIEWKIVKNLNFIMYLSKDEKGTINLIKEEKLISHNDKNSKFSELIFNNWMRYMYTSVDV